MGKDECKKWFDRVVDNLKERTVSLNRFNDDIGLCGLNDSIHVYSGIFAIAESVGAVVMEKTEYSKEYPYKYYFDYRGFRIFQLSEERIEENDNGNRKPHGE